MGVDSNNQNSAKVINLNAAKIKSHKSKTIHKASLQLTINRMRSKKSKLTIYFTDTFVSIKKNDKA